MPRKITPKDIQPAVERASTAGFAVAGEQTELVERLTKVLDELRAAGSVVVVGDPNVAAWSQDGGWFRDLGDGWGQKGGWVRTNDRGAGAVVRPPELREPAIGREIAGRVVVKKPTDRG